MARHVLLNNIAHKDLRVVTRHSAEFGDNVHSVPTFPTEYGDIQREYPIFFRKDAATGEFQSVALLGFEEGENLFLDKDGWNASYVPGMISRGPFLIGFQQVQCGGDIRKEPVIHVDMDSPRISKTSGDAVFLKHGGNTPYLDRISNILRGLQEGIAASRAMFKEFESHDLLQSVDVEVDLHTDEQRVLTGFYTINRAKLASLGGAELEKLNKAGFLLAAFLIVTSLNNVKKMIDMKNRRRAPL
jgi:hypothetical protein